MTASGFLLDDFINNVEQRERVDCCHSGSNHLNRSIGKRRSEPPLEKIGQADSKVVWETGGCRSSLDEKHGLPGHPYAPETRRRGYSAATPGAKNTAEPDHRSDTCSQGDFIPVIQLLQEVKRCPTNSHCHREEGHGEDANVYSLFI